HYNGLIEKGGKDAEAQLQLGIVEYQFGNLATAVTEFNKVLALNPKDASAMNNLGSVAFMEGDFAQAEKRFLQSSEVEADDANTWLNLMKTAIKLKKPDPAREYGAKAVVLSPGYKPFVDNLVKGL
ncbi:MAG: tetratricopeptide repeat protein, partial [Elusimicrobiota bacterium]